QVRSRLPIQADVEHVLGQLVQRLPCVLARFLLRVRVGVCRVQGDGLGQGRRQAGFYATRNGVVHVGIGGGRAAKAVRGPAFRARHASDLVFELVVEQRQAGLQAIVGVVQHADFLGQGFFRLKIRVSVAVAAAAGRAPVRDRLADVRRLEAR